MRAIRGQAILLLWIAALGLQGVSAQDDLPEGKGKELIENTCAECHGLDKLVTRLRTKDEWRKLVTTMVSKGATLAGSETETVIDYLFANFGADPEIPPAPAKVNVNKAEAVELQSVLELSRAEAEALVKRRRTKGNFKNWKDVAAVPGIDPRKIENKKERIVFE